MPIVQYRPEHFTLLAEMVSRRQGAQNLGRRPFVDFYYSGNPWCRLYLFLSDEGALLGTLGSEWMRFESNSREIRVRIGSNWNSLQPGVGGRLAKFSHQASPERIGLMFMGTRNTLEILQHYGWTFIQGIRGYFLNVPWSLFPGDSRWRWAANSVIRRTMGRPIPAFVSGIPSEAASISVREEHVYSEDLLPRHSPFALRFAPSIEQLRWRYSLKLNFVRYRLFRVISQGTTKGYVILNDAPERLLVAQCDAEDARVLAYGILLSILEAGRNDIHIRTVFLASCHAQMQQIFEEFGFRTKPGARDLPFAFRSLPAELEGCTDTRKWLVNFDWADNGLLPPFLDQRRRAQLHLVSQQS